MTALPEQHEVEVADGCTVVVQDHGELGVSNATVVIDGAEALVVDTMLMPDMATGILAAVARRGARPVLVINTHHHLDHVGGNERFGATPVVAHPVTAGLVAGMARDLGPLRALMPRFASCISRLRPRVPAAVDPADLAVPHGGRVLAFTGAHTPADLALWFADRSLLVAGDLCGHGVTPLAVHASVAGWLHALDVLSALTPRTVVSGHGEVGDARDLQAVAVYLRALLAVAHAAVESGAGIDEALAAADLGPVGDWREPGRTRVNLERAMAEAGSDSRPPPPSSGRPRDARPAVSLPRGG